MNVALLLSLMLTGADPAGDASLVVVVGAEGAAEYGAQFQSWAESWRSAAERGTARFTLIGRDYTSFNTTVQLYQIDHQILLQVHGMLFQLFHSLNQVLFYQG